MAKMKKRADGRYLKVVVDARTGKKIYFYGLTVHEVNQKILKYTETNEKGRLFKDVAEEWFEETAPTLAYQSLKSYKPALKLAIEEFGEYYIKEIKPKDINAYLRRLAKDGLSQKTINQKRLILNLILKHAVISNDIEVNPCTAAVMPKDSPKQQRHAASESDEKIIKESADIWLFPYFALMTGMRKGEILALQWKDVDFDNNLISVTKSVYHVGDRPEIKIPKTEESVRVVPLLNPLKQKLLGRIGRSEEYIFGENNKPLTNRRFITLWKQYREKTGVKCTAHELRHSFATVAIENEISPKVVQEILGHKQLSTTMDIYTDIRRKSILSAMDKLNEIM